MDEVDIADKTWGNGVCGGTPHGLEDAGRDEGVVRRREGAPDGEDRHEQGGYEHHGSAPRPVRQGHPPDVARSKEKDANLRIESGNLAGQHKNCAYTGARQMGMERMGWKGGPTATRRESSEYVLGS